MKQKPSHPIAQFLIATFTICVSMLCVLEANADTDRRGPVHISIEPHSGKLLVLCAKSGTIARIDPVLGLIEEEIEVGDSPFDIAFHPDESHLYVSCRRGQEIVELDAHTLAAVRRFQVQGDPTGVSVSGDGRRLYCAIHSMDQVVVFDLETGKELKRMLAGNGPEMIKLSPTDGRVYITNLLSNPEPPDKPCQNEITVLDDTTGFVVDRIILKNANVGRQIVFTSDGSLAIVVISRPKNLVPMVQVARGWVVTNGFAIVEPSSDAPPVQLLLDLPNQSFSDPHSVVITPDDNKFYISSAGSDMVLSVDLASVTEVVQEVRNNEISRYADNLGLSRRYVTSRIPVGANPQAMTIGPNGKFVYVANRLDDSISVIDTSTDSVVRTMIIGDPSKPDRLLQGERFFHSAAKTFQNQFCCVSCHPDGGFDGLQYDLEPDDLGKNILDNRNLRAVKGTAPFKWVGTNPDITTQCGSRTAKWITRTGWLSSMEVVSLAAYIRSIPAVVNPYLAPDGKLTPAQLRGKKFFERDQTADGIELNRNQCHFCHSGPQLTNYERFDVGTQSPSDKSAIFDTPHLTNIFESAPYLHDGRAATLEEIWTLYNLDDKHGVSSDWTKQQLNDLVEYLKVIGAAKEKTK